MIQRDSRFCASSSLFLVLSCPWLVIRYSVVGLLCFCMISIALIDMYVIHNFLFNWRLLSVWKYAVVICMQPNHAFFSNFFSEKNAFFTLLLCIVFCFLYDPWSQLLAPLADWGFCSKKVLSYFLSLCCFKKDNMFLSHSVSVTKLPLIRIYISTPS